DQMLLERRAGRAGLHLLEAVNESQRLGVEDGELLLDRDREIAPGLEPLPGARDLLLGSQFLGLTHGANVSEQVARAAAKCRRPRGMRTFTGWMPTTLWSGGRSAATSLPSSSWSSPTCSGST